MVLLSLLPQRHAPLATSELGTRRVSLGWLPLRRQTPRRRSRFCPGSCGVPYPNVVVYLRTHQTRLHRGGSCPSGLLTNGVALVSYGMDAARLLTGAVGASSRS